MEISEMSKKVPSQEHIDNVSKAIYRTTITMTLVIIVFGIMILPYSDPSTAAFVPLVLSMVISIIVLVCSLFSLRKQVKKEMQRKAEMGPLDHLIDPDEQENESSDKN